MSDTATPTTNSLTLPALLIGKARTSGDHLQVTLRVQQDILTLNLRPEDADFFPDLSATIGGGHPLYDPTQVVYNTAVPSYRITISPVEPEPLAAPVAIAAEPSVESEPESAVAAAPAEGV